MSEYLLKKWVLVCFRGIATALLKEPWIKKVGVSRHQPSKHVEAL